MSDDRTAAEAMRPILGRVADLAADLFDAPVASLILTQDGSAPAMAAALGLDIGDAGRLHALCAGAMSGTHVLVVSDAAIDPRLGGQAAPCGAIRFLAAAALVDRDGRSIGLLCVADRTPHPPLPDRMRTRLAALAALAVEIVSGGPRPPGRRDADGVVSAPSGPIIPTPPSSGRCTTSPCRAGIGEHGRTAISA